MSDNIKTYLDSLCPKINDLLVKTGAIVSGSTAVWYYLKEHGIEPNFELADIDIYMGYDNGYSDFMDLYNSLFRNKKNFEDYQFEAVSFYSGRPYTPIGGALAKGIPKPFTEHIDFVRTGFIGNIKVDMIEISKKSHEMFKDNIAGFVEKYFDFDFCKCYYDGKTLRSFCHDATLKKSCDLRHLNIVDSINLELIELAKYQKAIIECGETPQSENYQREDVEEVENESYELPPKNYQREDVEEVENESYELPPKNYQRETVEEMEDGIYEGETTQSEIITFPQSPLENSQRETVEEVEDERYDGEPSTPTPTPTPDYLNVIARIRKYKSRGFNINTSNFSFFDDIEIVRKAIFRKVINEFREVNEILSGQHFEKQSISPVWCQSQPCENDEYNDTALFTLELNHFNKGARQRSLSKPKLIKKIKEKIAHVETVHGKRNKILAAKDLFDLLITPEGLKLIRVNIKFKDSVKMKLIELIKTEPKFKTYYKEIYGSYPKVEKPTTEEFDSLKISPSRSARCLFPKTP